MKHYYRDQTFKFDVDLLRACASLVAAGELQSPTGDEHDVQGVLLTQIPGHPESRLGANVHGLYWTDTPGGRREHSVYVNERLYTELAPEFKDTYLEEVVGKLKEKYEIGRVRMLWKHPRTCLSRHYDPEPRLHVPIVTNPEAHMVIENESFHMPADGCVYVTNTRKKHTAYNGGLQSRVHLVATLPGFKFHG